MTESSKPRPGMPDVSGAAQQLLDAYLDDLRLRIVREAIRYSSSGDKGRVLGKDVSSAISRIAVADRLLPRPAYELLTILLRPRIAIIVASVFVVFGVGIAIASSAIKTESTNAASPLSVATGLIAGMAMAFVAQISLETFVSRRSRSRREAMVAAQNFIAKMARLERTMFETVIRLTGKEEGSPVNLRTALTVLVERKKWAAADVDNFRALMQIRNRIVHEDTSSVVDTSVLAEADRLIAMLLSVDLDVTEMVASK